MDDVSPSVDSTDLEILAEANAVLLPKEISKFNFQASCHIFTHVFEIYAIIIGRCSASQLEPAGGHA